MLRYRSTYESVEDANLQEIAREWRLARKAAMRAYGRLQRAETLYRQLHMEKKLRSKKAA